MGYLPRHPSTKAPRSLSANSLELREWLLKAGIPPERLAQLLTTLEEHWITDVSTLRSSVGVLERHLPAAAYLAISRADLRPCDDISSKPAGGVVPDGGSVADTTTEIAAAAVQPAVPPGGLSSPMKLANDGFASAGGSACKLAGRGERTKSPSYASSATEDASRAVPRRPSAPQTTQVQETRARDATSFRAEASLMRTRLRAATRVALSPAGGLARLWEGGVLTAAVLFVVVAMPLEVGVLAPLLYSPLWWCNRVVEAIFWADVGMRFCLAYQEPELAGGRLVFCRRRIALHYLRTWLAVDLLAAMPAELALWGVRLVLASPPATISASPFEQLLRLTKLLKLARPGHIHTWLHPLQHSPERQLTGGRCVAREGAPPPRATLHSAQCCRPAPCSARPPPQPPRRAAPLAASALRLVVGGFVVAHWLGCAWAFAGRQNASELLLMDVSPPPTPPGAPPSSPPYMQLGSAQFNQTQLEAISEALAAAAAAAALGSGCNGSAALPPPLVDPLLVVSSSWLGKAGLLQMPLAAGDSPALPPAWTLYSASVEIAIAHLAGLSAAPTPANWIEQFVSIASSVVAAAARLAALSMLCSALALAFAGPAAQRQRTLVELRTLCKERHLPPSLRKRLTGYFLAEPSLDAGTRRGRLLAIASPQLQLDVAAELAPSLLGRVPFLPASLSRAFLASVVLALHPQRYSPNEFLPSEALTIVEAGLAAKHGRILSAGCCFGEDVLLSRVELRDTQPAIARTHVQVVRISREALISLAAPHPIAAAALRRATIFLALRRVVLDAARSHAAESSHASPLLAMAPPHQSPTTAASSAAVAPLGAASASPMGHSDLTELSSLDVAAEVRAACSSLERRMQERLQAMAATLNTAWPPPSHPPSRTPHAARTAAPRTAPRATGAARARSRTPASTTEAEAARTAAARDSASPAPAMISVTRHAARHGRHSARADFAGGRHGHSSSRHSPLHNVRSHGARCHSSRSSYGHHSGHAHHSSHGHHSSRSVGHHSRSATAALLERIERLESVASQGNAGANEQPALASAAPTASSSLSGPGIPVAPQATPQTAPPPTAAGGELEPPMTTQPTSSSSPTVPSAPSALSPPLSAERRFSHAVALFGGQPSTDHLSLSC